MLLNWITSAWLTFTILCSGGVWTAAWHACGDQLVQLEWFAENTEGCGDADETCGDCCTSGVATIAPGAGLFHSPVHVSVPVYVVDVQNPVTSLIQEAFSVCLGLIHADQPQPPGRGRPIDFLAFISVFRI